MVRQIIHIDEEKCNGCGLCASACHEGAIEMVKKTSVTASETAFPAVRPVQLPSKRGKHRNMTKLL